MLRDDLLSACAGNHRATLALPSPELPSLATPLFVRELRGDDLTFVSKSETGLEDRDRWAVRAISDASANRVLADQDLDWISGESGLPTPLLERAYWAARQVTGFTEENRKSFLTVSAAAPTGSAVNTSPSSSPAPAASGTSRDSSPASAAGSSSAGTSSTDASPGATTA